MPRFSRRPQLPGDLFHWQHDTFLVRWRERWPNPGAFTSFALDSHGNMR